MKNQIMKKEMLMITRATTIAKWSTLKSSIFTLALLWTQGKCSAATLKKLLACTCNFRKKCPHWFPTFFLSPTKSFWRRDGLMCVKASCPYTSLIQCPVSVLYKSILSIKKKTKSNYQPVKIHIKNEQLTCVGGILLINFALFENKSCLKSFTLVIDVVLS